MPKQFLNSHILAIAVEAKNPFAFAGTTALFPDANVFYEWVSSTMLELLMKNTQPDSKQEGKSLEWRYAG
jgi:hypothetical protein